MRVKNWDKFQHYKSGRGAPPWIKLHRGLLNDKDWFALDPAAAKTLISIWILAAETDGNLPAIETIAFRLRIDSKLLAKHISLCSDWIIDDASNVLADCYQVATPETETETETDIAEASQSKSKFSAISHLISIGVDADIANDWIDHRKTKKAAVTKTAISGIEREAQKAGWSLTAALAKSCERGWTGFKAEWVAGEVAPNVAAANHGELITLPDGSQITRAQQSFLKRVMA